MVIRQQETKHWKLVGKGSKQATQHPKLQECRHTRTQVWETTDKEACGLVVHLLDGRSLLPFAGMVHTEVQAHMKVQRRLILLCIKTRFQRIFLRAVLD